MKYLLDSNIVSEPVKAKPDPAVVAWLDSNELECAVSTIALAELRYGIERLPEGKRRRQLERDFAFLRQDLGSRVVAFDEAEAAEWGRYAATLERELGRDAQRSSGEHPPRDGPLALRGEQGTRAQQQEERAGDIAAQLVQ